MSPSAAREQTRVARRLRDLPAVRTAFTGGRLSFSKVRAITRVAVPTTEEALVETAESATAAQLDRLCRGLAVAGTADDAVEEVATAHLRTTWTETGTLRVRGELTAEQGAVLLEALALLREQSHQRERAHQRAAADLSLTAATAATAGAPSADEAELPGDAERDPAVLGARADAEALTALARHALSVPPEPAPASPVRVVLHATRASLHGLTTVGSPYGGAPSTACGNASAEASPVGTRADRPVEPPLDPTPEPAELDAWGATIQGGPGVHHHTARRLACSASADEPGDIDAPRPPSGDMHTHPDPDSDLHPRTDAHPAPETPQGDDDRGRHRAPTRRQRRALLHRDGGCRFPGCTRRRGLDAHHLVHWADGGRTLLDNLVLLCEHHHVALHEGGWVLRWATHPGALLVATAHDGRVLLSAPPLTGSAAAARSTTGINDLSLTGRQTGDPLHLGYAVAVLST